MSACGLKQYQISGPAWIQTTGFNIEAKLPPAAAKEQIKPMLQTLLAERFHLAVHRVFALVFANNRPKHCGERPRGWRRLWAPERQPALWQATN